MACENTAPMTVRSLVLLVVLLLAAPIHAHDTWLAPDRFRGAKAGPVTLSLSSGMEFPKLDHAIAPDRVASARWHAARARGALLTGAPAAHALEFRADRAQGMTVYSVVLHPRPSKLKREQVREYIDHLGIPNANEVFAAWQQTSKAEQTDYRYMKYAKTFAATGAPDSSRSWADPAEMRLELIPQNDPTCVPSGGTLDVMLLDRGKPLPRYPVALLREGAKEPASAVTDAEGRVRLTLPAAGRYMLRATTLEPSADTAARWDVHLTTITFHAE